MKEIQLAPASICLDQRRTRCYLYGDCQGGMRQVRLAHMSQRDGTLSFSRGRWRKGTVDVEELYA